LVVQTLWAEKIQSTTDAGSLNTFGRNEIEVAAYFIGTSSHCVFSKTIQNLRDLPLPDRPTTITNGCSRTLRTSWPIALCGSSAVLRPKKNAESSSRNASSPRYGQMASRADSADVGSP